MNKEDLGFLLAVDKCGRGCTHCCAFGIKQKMEVAPFEDLSTRLRIAGRALIKSGIVNDRTIHGWRIGDLLDYRHISQSQTRTVADLSELWNSCLGQPLYTVTTGSLGVSWRQAALENLALNPALSSQIKLTITPFDPRFHHPNYIATTAHDVATLWPLTLQAATRPEAKGQPKFRINVKISPGTRESTLAKLWEILKASGVNKEEISKLLSGGDERLRIKPVYDLRIQDSQPRLVGSIALAESLSERLKPEPIRNRMQLGFRPDGRAFEVDLWAFKEKDLSTTFTDWFGSK